MRIIPRTTKGIAISLPKDLLPLVQARAIQLDKNISQYFRGLAREDIATAIDGVKEIIAIRKRAADEAAAAQNPQNGQSTKGKL